MREIDGADDIYPVFRELFKRQERHDQPHHLRLLRVDLSAAGALRPRDRAHRPRRLRARHLRQPDRGHQLRADDRRLLLRRAAHQLPALVLRQAVRRHGADLSARPDGAGLRDRDQLRPLHRLSHGGEHPAHAGPGDRPRLLRPQQLLQGQLPVPHLDQRRRHHRLPGVRPKVHRPVRGALRRGRGRAAARLLSRPDESRGGSLQAPVAAVHGRGAEAPAGAGGLSPVPDQRPVADPAGQTARRRSFRSPLARGAPGEHPLFHREERPPAGALAARGGAHRAQDRASTSTPSARPR